MPPAETASSERLSLEIPLDVEHILTARSFASGVARSFALSAETTDVLRLALSEICSEAIERRRGGRIVIQILADLDQLRVTVVATGVLDETQTNPSDATYRRTLIDALVTDATFSEDQDRLNVMFTLRPEGDV